MIKNIVFDIGRVLISWDARCLYRKIFKTDDQIEKFLRDIDFYKWNNEMDLGKPFAQGVAELQAKFPQYASAIERYHTNWSDAIPGALDEPVTVLKKLKSAKYPVYALTNFAKDKFELSQKRFDFLNVFDGIVVSSVEKVVKPDPKIFKIMCKRYNLMPNETLFIDDSDANIKTAKELGFQTILFKHPALLLPQVQKFGVNIK